MDIKIKFDKLLIRLKVNFLSNLSTEDDISNQDNQQYLIN